MPLVQIDSEYARFGIDVYRRGSKDPESTGATCLEDAVSEISKLGATGNFDRIQLFRWIDYTTEWGQPIDEWLPEDFPKRTLI